MKFLRMVPGYGETVIAEGEARLDHEREELGAEFRRQLEAGKWAGVPITDRLTGRREAQLVTSFDEIPPAAERVLFWPRAAGGCDLRMS